MLYTQGGDQSDSKGHGMQIRVHTHHHHHPPRSPGVAVVCRAQTVPWPCPGHRCCQAEPTLPLSGPGPGGHAPHCCGPGGHCACRGSLASAQPVTHLAFSTGLGWSSSPALESQLCPWCPALPGDTHCPAPIICYAFRFLPCSVCAGFWELSPSSVSLLYPGCRFSEAERQEPLSTLQTPATARAKAWSWGSQSKHLSTAGPTLGSWWEEQSRDWNPGTELDSCLQASLPW